ncbi:3-hydroxyacyl-CoA dehydrogenase NAD-binding domain-containing protein [Clavibacter nebraskensis]|uniref:3-hydroxyacyl-CoA dehydrogenase NAD binding domain-containing protein n=1 Tax=Clavibacter nebraskensis TaxID=31963 RepID=A0ABY4MPF2_9MICO|nr:3-hydroxyacyl-CoA dehydrogenase NAD-binding domain-containing protein [Clavibacter nebraskensis]KXU21829.1 hypothetical protein VV38_00360 [Clavibacter nebraskensis]OAH18916.1 hypothetical protein A3Q38_10880 [Clavibacter nebraskensis]QGV68304.1 hypothetical protein EGX37_00675 [Clavibacter nebraskensis]QGV71097.1 hypothetical protein EGX35_00675 [Clavibacter nebraskensis]UQB05146.1 hypothetical protein LIV34_000137 [Clavibacter nebraskensis]
MPAITKVTVLGAGVLGAQIAFQAANHGKTVTGYDVDDAALEAARGRLDAMGAQAWAAHLKSEYIDQGSSAWSRARGPTRTADAVR